MWSKGSVKMSYPKNRKSHIVSDETKTKIRETLLGRKRPELSGPNHPRYGKHHTEEARRKQSEDTKHWIACHHINYNKLDNRPENLLTLCLSCNTKVNQNREEWQAYFERR